MAYQQMPANYYNNPAYTGANSAYPGGTGGSLYLWRGHGRPARSHRRARALRDWRNQLHRPARCQPHGQQLLAGVRRHGAGSCRGDC